MKINKSASHMISKTLTALAMTAGIASAGVLDNQKLLEDKVDTINAHRGIFVTGEVRGVAEGAYFDTDQDKYGKNIMPDVERNEFVNADLNFLFRPWETVRANVMLRMYAGMQDYFASSAKYVEVPWMNVEGQVGNFLYWTVGNYRQAISPLTLFTPGIDILYEPTIFARQRHMAEKQQLLEGNKRNLEGATVQFRKNLGDAAGELRVEGLFARVNRAQEIDLSGAEGNILPNDSIAGATMASNMDKFMLALNAELLPLSKNLYVGATGMYIFDNEDSRSTTMRHWNLDPGKPYEEQKINPFEIAPQNTIVASGRLGADVAGFLGNKNLVADLAGEFAMSIDDAHTPVYTVGLTNPEDPNATELDLDGDGISEFYATDADGNYINYLSSYTTESKTGMAINANVNVGFVTDKWGVRLSADVVRNDSNWFNNLAQSSSFFAQRILNADYDGETVKYGVNSPLYSTFDALYHFAPKFSPVSRVMKTDDAGFERGQNDSYNIAPYNKNSFGTNIYTKEQLALLNAMMDPAVQLTLPNGLATANRQGAQVRLVGNVGDWAEITGLFSTFSQVSPIYGLGSVSYTEFGGGAKVDVFKALGFKRPLEISGSYKHSERAMDAAELKTDFINAGFYFQYMPRLGITAGFQMINMEMSAEQQTLSSNPYIGLTTHNMNGAASLPKVAPMVKGTEMQWMVGLDYTLDKFAWLSLNLGQISVENVYNTAIVDPSSVINLPAYYDGTVGEYTSKFTQMIVQASINVEF